MLHLFLAQISSAAATTSGTAATDPNAQQGGSWTPMLMYPVLLALLYFLFFRPQTQAKKKQDELMKSAKTGDQVVTTGGIHGVITNVKDKTVMVKVADNVKIEVDKTHLEKIVRDEPVAASSSDGKVAVTKS